MRKLYIFGLIGLAALIIGLAWAEQMTFSTYYPAPYGVYREMRAMRMAVGDDYIDGGTYSWEDGTIDPAADLIVEGNVGIGTASPGAKLDVDGKVRMRSQTQNSDSDDTVATKGYVDAKAGSGFTDCYWTPLVNVIKGGSGQIVELSCDPGYVMVGNRWKGWGHNWSDQAIKCCR